MSDLVLNLKKKYFDQIKSGEKTEEYRAVKPFWKKKLEGKTFGNVVILLGYPKTSDMCDDNRIVFPFTGISLRAIQHPEFGDEPVTVYVIKLSNYPECTAIFTEGIDNTYELTRRAQALITGRPL